MTGGHGPRGWRRDPLLAAAKALATLFLVLLALIAFAMPMAIAALFLYPDVVFAELGSHAGDVRPVAWAITALLVGFIGFAVLGIVFLVQLRRMIDSVGAGDPFIAGNARRLSRMGWIMAAGQLLTLLLAGFARYVQDSFPDKNIDLDLDISLEGILVTMLLFILARVFRQGACLRAEVEGTV